VAETLASDPEISGASTVREKARRALVLAAVFALGLVASLASTNASAAVRAVLFVYRYPASGNCAGVALYHGASRADIDAGARLTRVDLGLRSADAQGNVNVSIAGFDDTRDCAATTPRAASRPTRPSV
jgi:hypothetical protein